MAAEFEQNQIAFETMLGSAEKATQVMGDLRKFAAETPFSSKEVTEGARQLLAYGFAADDLIPSLKTIGTLAAGVSKPLGELVYNVGTTKVQGGAMQLDINQLSEKGLDVYPGLAKALKVDQAEVRKLVEEGRVDWNTYKSVLEELSRTRFSGMLEKQANSLKGAWEQMTDAFDRAKLKLGQVVVRELGLKAATKDAEGFANRLEKFVDGPFVTGGIRLLGELGRAVANLASEFGKASFDSASIFGEMASQVPVLKNTFDSIEKIIHGAKEFKIDPRDIEAFAIEGSKDVLKIGTAIVIEIIDFGRTLKSEVLDPIRELFKDIKDARELYDILSGRNTRKGLLEMVTTPPAVVAQRVALGQPAAGAQPIDDTFAGLERFNKKLESLGKTIDGIGDDMKRRSTERNYIDQQQRETVALSARRRDLESAVTALKGFRSGEMGQLNALNFGNPLAGLASGMPGFQKGHDFANAGFGAGSVLMGALNVTKGEGSYLPSSLGLTRRQTELSKKVKDEFNPLDKLNRDLAELDTLFKAGGIDKREYDFARNKEVRGLADSLGLNQPARLPDTVLAGTQEDARLLAQAMSGRQQETTESLLKVIADHLQAIRNSNKNIEQSPAPKPVNVSLPGKG
ncbi:MAG TPA: tape measure protein [Gemmata sp.]